MSTEADSTLERLKEDIGKDKSMQDKHDNLSVNNVDKNDHKLENGDAIDSSLMNGDVSIHKESLSINIDSGKQVNHINSPSNEDGSQPDGKVISENGRTSSPAPKKDVNSHTGSDSDLKTSSNASCNSIDNNDSLGPKTEQSKRSSSSSSNHNISSLEQDRCTTSPKKNSNDENKNKDSITNNDSNNHPPSPNSKDNDLKNNHEISENDTPVNVSDSSADTTVKPSLQTDNEVAESQEDLSKECKKETGEKSSNGQTLEEANESVSENSASKNKEATTSPGDSDKPEDVQQKDPSKKKEKSPKKKKKGEIKHEFVKRVTRSASGISKQIRYTDLDPKLDFYEDDDIKITKEVVQKSKKDEDEVQMIEQSDPLAISEADVKKAKRESSGNDRMKISKAKDGKSKDNSNVIIIETNSLIKNQTVSVTPNQPSRPVLTQNHVPTNQHSVGVGGPHITTVQAAIQAITGGNPAIQGLQSAYLNAIQQVLAVQGSSQLSNPHYIATLQQYYNTLGALQDDAYVIEAPSFIVPYVMEGNPKESIKSFLKRINKELQDFVEKQREAVADKQSGKKTDDNKDAELKDKSDKTESIGKEKDTLENADKDGKRDRADKKQETADERKMDVDEDKSENKEKTEEDERAISDKSDDKNQDREITKEKSKETDENSDKTEKKDVDEKMEIEENETKTKEMNGEIGEGDANKENEGKEKTDKEKEDTEKTDKEEETEKEIESKEETEKENESKEITDKENEGREITEDKKARGEEDDEEIVEVEPEPKEDLSHLGRWENYYRSSLGKFFLNLGLDQVQEFIQSDLLRMQKKRLDRKTVPSKEDTMAMKVLERQLKVTREKNEHLLVALKTCRFCSFKTESQLVMERHLESPHMVNYTYKCNFCDFETRGPQVILFHIEAEHNIRGRLERAPAFFQCPMCPFEDNNKSKMTRHSLSCIKKFKADRNCDLLDWEPPAKIPKVSRGRSTAGMTSHFGKNMESLRLANILPKTVGGALGLNLQNVLNSGLLASAVSPSPTGISSSGAAALAASRGRGRPVGSYKNVSQTLGSRTSSGSLMYSNRGSFVHANAQQLNIANQVLQSVTQGSLNRSRMMTGNSASGALIPGLAASSSITIQSVQNKSGSTKSPQQPSISITPLPRAGGQTPSNTSAKSVVGSSSNNQRPAFVICEICDGYIKDLEQLRNHMNLIHKVKIHPKMIYNRPPLNCQKCQHRFFTDQGLERHLLGTHGLVTSSMQEAANKGKDAGRCPICGKVFQWKLLNHVSRDHKMTLKPAHLSYKCTVCTATFNMYRLFENHVYSAHSVVNKNKTDGSSSSSTGGGSTGTSTSSPSKKNSGSDAPLKINDEITIIPQPAAKSPKGGSAPESTNSTAKKKTESSPSVSKEITITKVGSSRSGSKRQSGVEVISLDGSPQKRPAEDDISSSSSSAAAPAPAKKSKTRESATSKKARST